MNENINENKDSSNSAFFKQGIQFASKLTNDISSNSAHFKQGIQFGSKLSNDISNHQSDSFEKLSNNSNATIDDENGIGKNNLKLFIVSYNNKKKIR